MSLKELKSSIDAATGASKALDQQIAETLNVAKRDFTSSVDDCITLIHELFPKAHWHLGRAGDGVSVYATIEDNGHRSESSGVTIPLVLLAVIVAHLMKH